MSGRISRTLLAMATVTAVVPALAPTPATALAVEDGVDLVVEADPQISVREGGADGFVFHVTNYGETPATGVVVTVDAAGLSSRVKMTDVYPGSCSASGSRFTCRWPELGHLEDLAPGVTLEVIKGAPAGSAGSIEIQATADQADTAPGNNSATVAVRILVPIYADLHATTDSPRAAVGDVVTVGVRVTNNGPHDSGAWAVHVGEYIDGLRFVSGPCHADGGGGQDCPGRLLTAGQAQTIALRFRVTAARNYYCGLSLRYQYPDPNPSDGMCGGDHGIVTVAGGIGGGSTGSSGSVGSGGPGGAGTGSPGAGGSASRGVTSSPGQLAGVPSAAETTRPGRGAAAGARTVGNSATMATSIGTLAALVVAMALLLRRHRRRRIGSTRDANGDNA